MALDVSPDVVLVNPGNTMKMYESQKYAQDFSAKEPPVWVGLLANFLLHKGFSVEVIDANCERLSPQETAKRVVDMHPVLAAPIVYGHNPSASTQVMPSAGEIAQEIKRLDPNQKVIHVGGHVTALPEQTLREEHADFVAHGEGMSTLQDLITALKAGEKNLSKVRGLVYWEDETAIRKNPPAPLLQNLDEEMPGMALEKLPMHLYRAHDWHCFGERTRMPYLAMYTTLGCPFHCDFCCIQSPFKPGEQAQGMKPELNSYRFWDPKTVISQIEYFVEKLGGRHIKIADEMFVLNRRHVMGICDLIIERGYDLNIWSYSRVDTLKDEELAEKLRRAGMKWLCFGIEAGSHKVRAEVDKDYSQDRIYDVIALSQKYDISVLANYIFGLPEDTYETMQETLDLALALNTEFINMYCTMAYPGSKLYQDALKNGWPLPKTWMGYAQHSAETTPLPTRYLSGDEVLVFKNQAMHRYLSDPKYHKLVLRKFGPQTLVHIQELGAIYQERTQKAQLRLKERKSIA